MNKTIHFLLLLALSVGGCSNVTFHSGPKKSACMIGEFTKDEALRVKQAEFGDITPVELNQFALDLLPCVGDPDPEMRDGIVYESLSFLLRNEMLSDETKTQLMTAMMKTLNGPDDKNGFLKPFAALDLSELARADRIEPYLSTEQRSELVVITASYLEGISDYRGFEDDEGWRHGVAHSADIVLQLTLNKNITDAQLADLRDAVGSQIAPLSGHAYIHGESERLARPILYMARRGTISQEQWADWIAPLADPAPFEHWGDVYKSEAGLTKLHNTKAFLNAIYVNASATSDENIKMLETPALTALKQLP